MLVNTRQKNVYSLGAKVKQASVNTRHKNVCTNLRVLQESKKSKINKN